LCERQINQTNGRLLPGYRNFAVAVTLIFPFFILSGFIPYGVPFATHPMFVFGFAISLWLPVFLSGILGCFKLFNARLVPLGAPDWVVPVLVFVELIRQLVRPFVLTLRLSLNLAFGHVVLRVLGNRVLYLFLDKNTWA